jgi:phosphate transport system substrate-binding protein
VVSYRISWLVLSVLTSCREPKPTEVIRIDGSSTVFPITRAIAEAFHEARPIAVTVGISGTGGGFKKFCAGQIDVSNASRPINPAEAARCAEVGVEYVEVPIAFDGIAIVVNAKNTWADSITTRELEKMWEPEAEAKVMRWNHVRDGWPDRELHLYGAGVDSGTYDYFTRAIVGKEHASRDDFTASEDDNVLVQAVGEDELALGFFGYAYYLENKAKLKVLAVDDGRPDNGDGPSQPSIDTVRIGTYQPLARPLFIYLAKKSLARPDAAAFAKFYLERAPEIVSRTGYLPLPEKAYALGQARIDAGLTGSMFGGSGSQTGVSIEQLLEREQNALHNRPRISGSASTSLQRR